MRGDNSAPYFNCLSLLPDVRIMETAITVTKRHTKEPTAEVMTKRKAVRERIETSAAMRLTDFAALKIGLS